MTTTKQVEIDCKVLRITEKALLIDDGKREVWIPRSQITDECEEAGETTSIFISEWLAIEKGLV